MKLGPPVVDVSGGSGPRHRPDWRGATALPGRRVQTLVDRRFNRARYDAHERVASSAHQLRDEVDPDSLRGELDEVVRREVQPRYVTAWNPPSRRGRTVTMTTGGQR